MRPRHSAPAAEPYPNNAPIHSTVGSIIYPEISIGHAVPRLISWPFVSVFCVDLCPVRLTYPCLCARRPPPTNARPSTLAEGDDNTGFQVKLLEINAEPAIELTGPRLAWILEDLFLNIGKVCVEPFFQSGAAPQTEWAVGETRRNLVKCMDTEVRGRFA